MKRLPALSLLVAGIAVAIWILSQGGTNLGLFVGRFHSLLVHFPIVFVLLAAFLEFFRGGRDRARTHGYESLLILLALTSTVAAGLTGYLLSYEDGFEEDTVYWHLRSGVVVAIGTAVTLMLHRFQVGEQRRWLTRGYRLCLGSTVLAVVITGHLGGTLAHGSDYLTQYLPAPLKETLRLGDSSPDRASLDLETTSIYEGVVEPVLRENCLECHNETRRRGGLSLASASAIRAGSESGPVIVPGDSKASELVRRITLPPHDEDRMPAGDRTPLEVGKVELIRWWIDEGASADQKIADAQAVPFAVQVHLDRIAIPRGLAGRGPGGLDLEPPDPVLVRKLEDSGFVVGLVAEQSPFLAVRLPSGQILDDSRLNALRSLAAHILWLDLSGVHLKQRSDSLFSGLDDLRRLNLSLSDAGNDDLRYLGGLSRLEYLNLYGTEIGDSGLEHLVTLKNLRSLYLWQTQVTGDGAATLARQLPRCVINLGAEQEESETVSVAPPDHSSGN